MNRGAPKVDTPWLTLKEGAAYVRLSYHYVRRLKSLGRFPTSPDGSTHPLMLDAWKFSDRSMQSTALIVSRFRFRVEGQLKTRRSA